MGNVENLGGERPGNAGELLVDAVGNGVRHVTQLRLRRTVGFGQQFLAAGHVVQRIAHFVGAGAGGLDGADHHVFLIEHPEIPVGQALLAGGPAQHVLGRQRFELTAAVQVGAHDVGHVLRHVAGAGERHHRDRHRVRAAFSDLDQQLGAGVDRQQREHRDNEGKG